MNCDGLSTGGYESAIYAAVRYFVSEFFLFDLAVYRVPLFLRPHFLFGCAPMINVRVEPLAMSTCLINGSFKGFPFSDAD